MDFEPSTESRLRELLSSVSVPGLWDCSSCRLLTWAASGSPNLWNLNHLFVGVHRLSLGSNTKSQEYWEEDFHNVTFGTLGFRAMGRYYLLSKITVKRNTVVSMKTDVNTIDFYFNNYTL